jgi:PBSX family phage terminase large subunit
MKLTIKQTQAIDYLEDDVTTEILFGGGAGGAKSFLGCYWILKMCLKYDGTRYVVGRWKRKYLYETTLNSFWEVCKLQGVRPEEHYKFNSQAGTITFFNGSQILLKDLFTYPSDANFDSLGSLEITGAFIDEANQIDEKAKNILKSRIRYKLDENGLIPKILYSCNPAKNWVYTEFYKPDKENTLADNKAFIQALATDNPFVSKHYIESLKELPKASKERLLFGNWQYDNDPSTLMEFDNIVNLWNNDHVIEFKQKYITADIARFGQDKTVVMVWYGLILKEIHTMDISAVNQSVDLINQLRQKHQIPSNAVCIDSDGVGGGTADYIKGCAKFVNNARPIKKDNYQNLKTQCYYALSDAVNKGQIYIETESHREEIIQELEYVKMHDMDKDNKLKILPKEKVKEHIGRSPDFSDAMAMRMYFEVKPKSSFG